MNVLTSPPELDEASIYRETLVHAARHLALGRDDVVRLAEVLNDRPWAECGPEEVALVVQHLRDIIRRSLRSAASAGDSGRSAP